MSKKVLLQLTAAVVIDGAVKRAGSEIEVSDAVAKNLLHRGKAKLANKVTTLNEEPPKEPVIPQAEDSEDPELPEDGEEDLEETEETEETEESEDEENPEANNRKNKKSGNKRSNKR